MEESTRVIEHQNYYKLPNGIECIDIVRYFNFDIGNVIKYCWRHGRKSEAGISDKAKALEDLRKARIYLEDEIKELENEINQC